MAAVMRAMGVESDQEILGLVGSEGAVAALMAPTLQEAKSMGIFIRQQALEYLGMDPIVHSLLTRLCIGVPRAVLAQPIPVAAYSKDT